MNARVSRARGVRVCGARESAPRRHSPPSESDLPRCRFGGTRHYRTLARVSMTSQSVGERDETAFGSSRRARGTIVDIRVYGSALYKKT